MLPGQTQWHYDDEVGGDSHATIIANDFFKPVAGGQDARDSIAEGDSITVLADGATANTRKHQVYHVQVNYVDGVVDTVRLHAYGTDAAKGTDTTT